MIVADNTLLVQMGLLVTPAEDARTAQRILESDADWRVPALWASEFRHVALKYVRAGTLSRSEAIRSARSVAALVTMEAVEHAEVIQIAADLGLSGYDAEYAALALRLGVPLVTSDRRLREAVPGALAPAALGAQ